VATVLRQYQAYGEQATGMYPASVPAERGAESAAPEALAAPAPTEEEKETDWLGWLLGVLATIAVLGLIPLWALVYRAWVRAEEQPAVPVFATPTPTVVLVTVPDVKGLPWEEARLDLEAVGLRFSLEEEPGAAVPAGTVIRQEPPAGERVPLQSEVRLYIAGAPERVEVPGVVDVPVETARQWLQEAGLQAAEVVVWSDRPEGLVIAQEPERGTDLEAGSVVTLTVSGGTQVPIEIHANLDNLIVLEQAELLRARFQPGEILSLSLRWRALTRVPERYVVFVHLIGPTGDLVAQEDIEPLRGASPTDTWAAGTLLWDPHQVYLPAGLQPGTYQVRTGMYPVGEPGNRLQVVDPGEAEVEANSILVAEVEIAP